MVSTADAFYLPELSDNQLSIRQVRYSGGSSFLANNTVLSYSELLSPGSLNLLIRNDKIWLLHCANEQLVRHSLSSNFVEHDALVFEYVIDQSAGSAEQREQAVQSLAYPVNLLQAGGNVYARGASNQTHESLIFIAYQR